jgi:hypothetical protein
MERPEQAIMQLEGAMCGWDDRHQMYWQTLRSYIAWLEGFQAGVHETAALYQGLHGGTEEQG